MNTTPQQRILAEIESAGGPIAAKELKTASRSYITTCLRTFHERGVIYIADYQKGEGNNNGLYARYAIGNLPDAVKPVTDSAELQRRRSERQRRARQSLMEIATPEFFLPTALPTFTPTYQFWGI